MIMMGNWVKTPPVGLALIISATVIILANNLNDHPGAIDVHYDED